MSDTEAATQTAARTTTETAAVPTRGCAVVLGATSPIAEAFCRQAAAAGYSVFAAARSAEAAKAIGADVAIRSRKNTAFGTFDALDPASIEAVFRDAEAQLGPVSLVLVAFGDMGSAEVGEPESRAEGRSLSGTQDVNPHDASDGNAADVIANVHRVLGVNFTGAALASELGARALARTAVAGSDDKPTLLGIASVAGDRGRQSNYPYGSAKGGYALYLQGLRNRFFSSGVHVATVKFGFIDTPMTHGMKTAIPIASPEAAAKAMLKATRKGTDVLYFPFFWRFIMLIIRSIPERLFKRLSL